MLSLSTRKLLTTSHLISSLGWLGAVLAFLALSIAASMDTHATTIQGAYGAMNLIGWAVIIPLACLAAITGAGLGLGTEWGLVRYRWVVTKLVLTGLLLIALIVHQITAVSLGAELAQRVGDTTVAATPALRQLGVHLIIDAGFAALFLVAITALSVFKPWGRTVHGMRLMAASTGSAVLMARIPRAFPVRLRVMLMLLGAALMVTFLALHVLGDDHVHHP